MKNYSTTYAAAITTFAPLIVMALGNVFGVNLLESEVVTIVGSIVSAIGFVVQILHRYSEGDVTIAGFRKQ
jgi:positive regulator of sigma E activity